MTKPTVLVTGGSGFAGSHLVEALLAKGITPHVTHWGSRESLVHDLLPTDHIHKLNLSDPSGVHDLLTNVKPTQLYHLAALASVSSSFDQVEETLQNNLKLQLVLLDELRTSFPETRTLIIGSSLEYDPFGEHQQSNSHAITEIHPLGPISPYAVSKVMQDLLALSYYYSYKLPILRVRPFNHTGERQSPEFAIPAFAKQIVAVEKGEQPDIRVGDLTAIKDISDVKDIVQAYITVMDKGECGEVYNLGSGQGYQMSDILKWLSEMSQKPIKAIPDKARMRRNDVPYLVADISKIKTLGWQPKIPIRQTLERVLNYWRSE